MSCVATAAADDGNISQSTAENLNASALLNVSALQSLLANSSANVSSYRFTLEMDESVRLTNLSNETAAPQVILLKSFGVGSMNLTAKTMKLVLASIATPLGDEDNATAIALEEYLINDTLYTSIDGNWTSLKLDIPNHWKEQNTVGQQIELLNQSEISLQGTETVDGQDCYKIKVAPNMSVYAQMASEQLGSILGPLNLTELYSNMTADLTYWIAIDSGLLKKTEASVVINLNPQSLGAPLKGPENQEMQIVANTTMLFRDYNSEVNITLPSEAVKAEALPLNLTSFTGGEGSAPA